MYVRADVGLFLHEQMGGLRYACSLRLACEVSGFLVPSSASSSSSF